MTAQGAPTCAALALHARRARHGLWALLALLAVAGPAPLAADEPAAAAAAPAPAAGPRTPPPVTAAEVEAALRRGVDWLVANQGKDGAWGSPASNLWDIYAPFPGSQQAFQVAASALALLGLMEVNDPRPEAAQALARGADWLVAHHAVGRPAVDVLYNTWAHAYALEALCGLHARAADPARREVLARAAAAAIDRLDRFQFAEGGWGYYNFDEKTRRPGPGSTSFTTATALLALDCARAQGLQVPARLIPRAVRDIEACRYPDGSFAYGYYIHLHPRLGVNQVKGSLARSPACLLALRAWARPSAARPVPVTEADARKALDDLEREAHFLFIARKYPMPHEAWYQNSGYFCFYGYYYASQLVALLPEAERARQREAIARRLVAVQEKDGSWWDYQLFGFHKAYGTGYVLAALARTRAPAPAVPAASSPGTPR